MEPRRLVVRRFEVAPGWPPQLEGTTIACVSDFHTGAPHVDLARVERVLDRVAALDADLVALLGDYVDPEVAGGERVAPVDVAALLSRLRAGRGVFAVLGNHDWHAEGDRVGRSLVAAGITVLENAAVDAGDGLWVVGLADATTRPVDVAGAFARVPDDAAVLVLSHDPDLFPKLPDRPSLTLSGHTHGGQVNIPFLRARATPSRYGDRYSRGLVREGARTLFVTSGIGTSRYPIRLGRPPEVVLLTVRTGSR